MLQYSLTVYYQYYILDVSSSDSENEKKDISNSDTDNDDAIQANNNDDAIQANNNDDDDSSDDE